MYGAYVCLFFLFFFLLIHSSASVQNRRINKTNIMLGNVNIFHRGLKLSVSCLIMIVFMMFFILLSVQHQWTIHLPFVPLIQDEKIVTNTSYLSFHTRLSPFYP